jgi:hypothetical protein
MSTRKSAIRPLEEQDSERQIPEKDINRITDILQVKREKTKLLFKRSGRTLKRVSRNPSEPVRIPSETRLTRPGSGLKPAGIGPDSVRNKA